MKIGKEYISSLAYRCYTFSIHNLQTFDISHASLSLTVAKLSTVKKDPLFWPNLYYNNYYTILIFLQYLDALAE